MADSTAKPLGTAWFVSSAALFLFFWASGFVAAKYGFPYAEPFTFLALRFAIASAALAPLCLMMGAAWPASRREAAHVIAAGLMVQTFYLVGVYQGIYLGLSTGVIALIVGLQPLITGALAGRFLGEPVTLRQWLGLALGFGGLGLVVWDRIGDGGMAGFWFGVLGLLSITFGTLYQKRFCPTVDIRTAVTLQNIASLVVIGLLAVVSEEMTVHWTGEFLFALLWSAFGLSVIAIMLYFTLVRRGAAAKVTSLIYLSPPTTAVMGYFAFHETLAPLALAGMAVAMVGVALVTTR